MTKRKSKPPSTETEPVHVPSPVQNNFPLFKYVSTVGVHGSLLVYATLLLPQKSTKYLDSLSILPGRVPLTSADHPQHPFLDALTDNPVASLLSITSAVIILQGWWGGWVRGFSIEYILDGTPDEKRMQRLAAAKQKQKALTRAWTAVLVASALFHVIIVLFGAPIFSYILHTYLLALLLSVLIVFTPAYVLGVPWRSESVIVSLTWTRLFAEFSTRNPIERAIVYPAIGAVVGCWAGVIPIALDWDRPWQAWPLTPALGSIAGYICGSLAALTTNALFLVAQEHVKAQRVKTA